MSWEASWTRPRHPVHHPDGVPHASVNVAGLSDVIPPKGQTTPHSGTFTDASEGLKLDAESHVPAVSSGDDRQNPPIRNRDGGNYRKCR